MADSHTRKANHPSVRLVSYSPDYEIYCNVFVLFPPKPEFFDHYFVRHSMYVFILEDSIKSLSLVLAITISAGSTIQVRQLGMAIQ